MAVIKGEISGGTVNNSPYRVKVNGSVMAQLALLMRSEHLRSQRLLLCQRLTSDLTDDNTDFTAVCCTGTL